MPFAVNRWQFNRLVFRASLAGVYHYIAAANIFIDYNVINVRIDIGKIEYVVVVISALRLRYSHNPAERLNGEYGAVPFTKEHKYMRSRAIPAKRNGLLEYQNFHFIIVSGEVLQVFLIFRKIKAEFPVLKTDTVLIFECLHNQCLSVFFGLANAVWKLNEKQRIYGNASRFICSDKLLALLQRFPQNNFVSATGKLAFYGFGAATANHAFEIFIEYYRLFYHLLGFYSIYVNAYHLVGVLHYRRCGNFNREVRRDGGDKILRGFGLRVKMALINNQNDCPPSFACAFNNA